MVLGAVDAGGRRWVAAVVLGCECGGDGMWRKTGCECGGDGIGEKSGGKGKVTGGGQFSRVIFSRSRMPARPFISVRSWALGRCHRLDLAELGEF
jgi:hypothetical protein